MNEKMFASGVLMIIGIFMVSMVSVSCFEEPPNNLSPSNEIATHASDITPTSKQAPIVPREFSYEKTVSNKPAGLVEYKNETFGIAFRYPGDWVINPAIVGNSTVIFIFAPLEFTSDKFRENINIVHESAENMTLDRINVKSLQEIKQMTDASILYENDTSISGIPAKEVVYIAKIGSEKLKFLMCYLVKDNELYAITYTAMPNAYSKFLDEVHEIIDSLQFYFIFNIFFENYQ